MKRWEILALMERFGVPREDWRPFIELIQDGKMARRLGRRIDGRYRPVLTEVYAILSFKSA